MRNAPAKMRRLLILTVLLIMVLAGSLALRNYAATGRHYTEPHSGEVIYIQPLGDVDKERLAVLQDILGRRFAKKIRLLRGKWHPSSAWVADRGQYDADLLRIWSEDRLPVNAFRYLVVTDADIFTDQYNFIFGQAKLNGKVCLISLNRFIALEKFVENPSVEGFDVRIEKLLVHELGHNFGLSHCMERKCVMRFANNMTQLDATSEEYCGKCLEILERKELLPVLNPPLNGVIYADDEKETGNKDERTGN